MVMNRESGVLWVAGEVQNSSMGVRAFETKDIGTLCTWFGSEADVVQWAGPKLSWRTLENDLHESFGASLSAGDFFSVVNKAGDLIGHFQLTRNKRTHQTDLSRVAIGPAYRNKGYAGLMLQAALQFAFDDPIAHRLELRVFDFNVPAIRAYERLGFQVEGVRRQSVYMNGDYWNTVVMGILRSEYETRKG
ncbi:MAG: GNAT family N-acetyltransferase [Parvibaculaceae bacterium]|nr:GNAT family N-acetyltransferase [Parvibaculaceae bacterium]